jgi:hypothetical protein
MKNENLIFVEMQKKYFQNKYEEIVILWESNYIELLNISTDYWSSDIVMIILTSYTNLNEPKTVSIIEIERLVFISIQKKYINNLMLMLLAIYYIKNNKRYKLYFLINRYKHIFNKINTNYNDLLYKKFEFENNVLTVLDFTLLVTIVVVILNMHYITPHFILGAILIPIIYSLTFLILLKINTTRKAKNFIIMYSLYFGFLNLLSIILVPKVKCEIIDDAVTHISLTKN